MKEKIKGVSWWVIPNELAREMVKENEWPVDIVEESKRNQAIRYEEVLRGAKKLETVMSCDIGNLIPMEQHMRVPLRYLVHLRAHHSQSGVRSDGVPTQSDVPRSK